MSLSTLWEIMEDRGVWPAAVHGVEKSRTWLNNGATTKLFSLPKSSIFALLEKHIYFVYLFFYFTILYWFCHTSTWIHHRCTHVPKKKKNGMTPPQKIKEKKSTYIRPALHHHVLHHHRDGVTGPAGQACTSPPRPGPGQMKLLSDTTQPHAMPEYTCQDLSIQYRECAQGTCGFPVKIRTWYRRQQMLIKLTW